MNRPKTVIAFVNIAHFIDHYAMLIFATAILLMGPALGLSYSDLLPAATPGFIAFGAGSLLTGWLGDTWSRRHMMAIFFVGTGASLIGTGFVQTPLQLSAALFAVGAFASIYHPVGTAMIVAYAEKFGREIGINGMWGNLGIALSALFTGGLAQFFGWRAAFIVPGVVTIGVGLVFIGVVAHEPVGGRKQAAAPARVPRSSMWRVLLALVVTVIASSAVFNAVTIVLPKLFAERLSELTQSPALLSLVTASVYLFGALTQFTIGHLIDRHPLRAIFLPLAVVLAPLLWLAVNLSGLPIILVAIGIVMGMFGQVTVNDAMCGRYTSDEWRSRAYAVRYFVGFTVAGATVPLVSWLYERGGFSLTLEALTALSAFIIAGALIFPREERTASMEAVQPAE